MYDAIVVGARVAGSPTAMLLARKGYKVLLVDRATFPSDIMSTHFLTPEGVGALGRWGLMDRMTATGCPPLRSTRLDFGFIAVEPPLPGEGDTAAYCPRRTLLDKLLVDAAVGAGAELREGFSVQELVWEDGRVTGIRGRGADGATVTEQTRIVIGADGKNSVIARSVDTPRYNERPSNTFGYYNYFSGITHQGGAEIYFSAGRVVFFFPTNDNLTCVAMELLKPSFHEFRSDIEGSFYRVLDEAGMGERVRAGRAEERFIGASDLPNVYRKPAGPGWALAGDAGFHKDPILGQGITDAFRDAEFLSEALDAGWSGREPLDAALAGYEQRRNAATASIYQQTCAMAQLPAYTPQMLQQMFGAAPAA